MSDSNNPAPLTFVQKIALKQGKAITLLRLYDASGRACFAVMLCSMNELGAIDRALNHGTNIDLTQHGEVLAKGWGHEVPDDIKAQLEAEYEFSFSETEDETLH